MVTSCGFTCTSSRSHLLKRSDAMQHLEPLQAETAHGCIWHSPREGDASGAEQLTETYFAEKHVFVYSPLAGDRGNMMNVRLKMFRVCVHYVLGGSCF